MNHFRFRRVEDIRNYFDEEGGDVQVLTENVRRERLPRIDHDYRPALNQHYYDGYSPADAVRHANRRLRRSRSDSPVVVFDDDSFSGPNSSNVVQLSDEDSDDDDYRPPPPPPPATNSRFYDYFPSFNLFPNVLPFQNRSRVRSITDIAREAEALLNTLRNSSAAANEQYRNQNPPDVIDMFNDSPDMNQTVEINDSPLPSNSQSEPLPNRNGNLGTTLTIDDDSDVEVIDRPSLRK